MIYVTARAANQIRSLLTHSSRSRAAEVRVLRLTFDGKSGIAMGLGEPAGDDVVIGDADGPVLAIPPQLARRLDGLVFDWIISEIRGLGSGALSFRPRLDEEPDLIQPSNPPASVDAELAPEDTP